MDQLPTNLPKVGRTILPRTRLELSRIGLGLAHMHIMRAESRTKLIQRALDLGITHFDTARFYSDGLSEVALGKAIKSNRRAITITSKFGLLPTPIVGSLGIAASPFRKARSAMSKLGLIQYPRRSYTSSTLQKSLHASLRALKTDYIDIYCLHEPSPDSRPDDTLFEELTRQKTLGSIRYVGVSGAHIDFMVERYSSSLDVIQSSESTWAESRFTPDITHSLFSDAVRRHAAGLGSESVRQLLVQALTRRRAGSVIVQTRHPEHLDQIVGWAAGS